MPKKAESTEPKRKSTAKSNAPRAANTREAVILQALISAEMYGLQICDEFYQKTGRELPLGSLYPTLDEMIRKGFVRAQRKASTHERGGNHRRYFRITASGRRALDEAQIFADAILGRVMA